MASSFVRILPERVKIRSGDVATTRLALHYQDQQGNKGPAMTHEEVAFEQGKDMAREAAEDEIAALKAERDALSADVARRISEASAMRGAMQRAADIIDTNLYHQREKVADAATILRQAINR